MTAPVIALREDTHVADLFATFASHGINHVPVTAADGRLAGIITRLDLLNLFGSQVGDRRAA
jgi:CBS domain-containing membrane protein